MPPIIEEPIDAAGEEPCAHEHFDSVEGPAETLPGGEVIVFACRKCKATVVDHEALIRLRVYVHNTKDENDALKAAAAGAA